MGSRGVARRLFTHKRDLGGGLRAGQIIIKYIHTCQGKMDTTHHANYLLHTFAPCNLRNFSFRNNLRILCIIPRLLKIWNWLLTHLYFQLAFPSKLTRAILDKSNKKISDCFVAYARFRKCIQYVSSAVGTNW